VKRTDAHRAEAVPAPDLIPDLIPDLEPDLGPGLIPVPEPDPAVAPAPSLSPQCLSAFDERLIRQALDWLRPRVGARARLRADSRAVRAGDVFIALSGRRHNGAGFIAQALQRGACAVLCDAQCLARSPAHDRSDTLPSASPDAADNAAQGNASAASQGPNGYVGSDPRVFILPSLHRFVGHLAGAFYGHPSHCIPLVAVTGTNGKTSVSYWMAAHWSAPSAVIGTLGERFFDPEAVPDDPPRTREDGSVAALTTPDAVALQTQLRDVAERGAQLVSIEASSIGLHQGRLQGSMPAVAVYTQLSRDHLDYHGSMQNYAQAKSTLFRLLGRSPWGAHAVIHLDDAWTPTMVDACPSGAALLFYGLGEDFDRSRTRARELAQRNPALSALLWAFPEAEVEDDPCGMRLRWRYLALEGGERHKVQSGVQTLSLLGRFNALNALAVAASWIALGRPVEQALGALSGLRPVDGRMERLGGGSTPLVVVDYAHTPDALEQVLLALRPLARRRNGRLICVVGAGGDRDAGKRALIGAVAVRHADQVCLTSDNPRSENPLQIIGQILSGARAVPEGSSRASEGCPAVNPGTNDRQTATFGAAAVRARCLSTEVDRAVAIDQVLAGAAREDVVLIAGKGHERVQEIGGQRLPFDDRQHAALALARHWSLAASTGARR